MSLSQKSAIMNSVLSRNSSFPAARFPGFGILSIVQRAMLLLSLSLGTISARDSVPLKSNWFFKLAEESGPRQPDFNAEDFQEVTLPHNWGWKEAQQGQKFYRGAGWYYRELSVSPQPHRRYFLRFGAASTVAEVFLNGKLIGAHRGAFGAFAFEITKTLAPDGKNLLAVKVSNAPQPDIAPISGDFSVYGGLYRSVELVETEEQNFTPTDHGSPGVAWLQTSVSALQAVLDVTAQVSNGAKDKRSLSMVTKVLDASGREVVATSEPIVVAPEATAPYMAHLVLPSPHLWNGRKDPYLYRAVVELRSAQGVVDTVEQPLGLRFYRVDPEKGFYLNGQPYHLHGVNRHQDRFDKGWAISESDIDEDVALIREIGATVIRGAHYEHCDYFYSLCDRAGLLVWAEIPQVNEIHGTVEFENTSRNQLLDLIRQNLNHPSIFAWSLFNEIGSHSEDPHRELQDLNNMAHGEDPTRPTIAAALPSKFSQMGKIPDLLGWNIYPGWYESWGRKEDYASVVARHRFSSRSGGLCLSEYGAGANINQHEDNPKQPNPNSQWHPEEWQAILHEAAWGQVKSLPYVWGTFVWNMFDFAVSSRHEGGVEGLNDKGLVTYDRKVRKDAFYFYKANWSAEPVLYINSRRFVQRTNAQTDVKVYSNAKEVELFLNGVSQGKSGASTNCVYLWKNIQLCNGANTIQAKAVREQTNLTDQCVWNLNCSK